MYRITFTLDLSSGDGALARETLRTLLRGLFWVDVLYLKAHPETPLLASIGAKLQESAGKTEVDWHDVPSSVERRVITPEAAMAWRAAEAFVRQGLDTRATLDAFADSRALPKRVTYVIDLFKGDDDRPLSHAVLQTLLHTLFWVDVLCLRAHPETPLLYQSGVRYEEEPIGQEDWQDIPTCLRLKCGDCEDLSCWRAAEIYVRWGVEARPTFIWKTRANGGYLYHIQVRYPDGRIEDPSRALGMR